MRAVRKLNVAGFTLTVCGAAAVGGTAVGGAIDADERSVIVAGRTTDEQVANAFRAGLSTHREDEPHGDGSISVLTQPSLHVPYLRGDGIPGVE